MSVLRPLNSCKHGAASSRASRMRYQASQKHIAPFRPKALHSPTLLRKIRSSHRRQGAWACVTGGGCFAVCRRGAVAMAVHCSAKSSAWHSHPAALVVLPTAPSHVPPRPPRTAARPKSCSLDRALTAVSHRRCHRRRRQACRPGDDPRQEAPSFTQRWQRPQHPPQQRPRHRLLPLLLRVRCPQPC